MAMRLDDIQGREVYTSDEEKLGKVEDIYSDRATNHVEWIAVKAGFLGMKRILVPIEGATMHGDHVHLSYTKQQLEDAPDIDDTRLESDDDERVIYGHYGLEYPGRSFAAAGDDYRRADDDSVVRHEEELEVGKREVDAGSVRLRKWVETKEVNEDVTLERETAQVRREPLDEVVDASEIGAEEVGVDLTAEEPVVAKQTVAKERVGLDTSVERDVERVADEVRTEHVEVDRDPSSTTR